MVIKRGCQKHGIRIKKNAWLSCTGQGFVGAASLFGPRGRTTSNLIIAAGHGPRSRTSPAARVAGFWDKRARGAQAQHGGWLGWVRTKPNWELASIFWPILGKLHHKGWIFWLRAEALASPAIAGLGWCGTKLSRRLALYVGCGVASLAPKGAAAGR